MRKSNKKGGDIGFMGGLVTGVVGTMTGVAAFRGSNDEKPCNNPLDYEYPYYIYINDKPDIIDTSITSADRKTINRIKTDCAGLLLSRSNNSEQMKEDELFNILNTILIAHKHHYKDKDNIEIEYSVNNKLDKNKSNLRNYKDLENKSDKTGIVNGNIIMIYI
tara:strand:- start:122 stop:610 length:489 start_codon:yes stop_codon:yes gene_type:complete